MWILPALISPLCYALVNHIDKYLLQKHLKGASTGSLLIISSIVGWIFSLIILASGQPVFSLPLISAVILMINGMIYITSLIPYFHSLERAEASIVASLFQITPVFSFIMGILLLHEQVQIHQIIGSLLIMLGAILITLESSPESKLKLDGKTLLFMILASFLTALNGILFKFAGKIEVEFWPSLFWEYTGFGLIALVFIIGISSYRKQFLYVVKNNTLKTFSFNLVNEILAIGGKSTLHLATLMAPIAIVFWTAEGFQPFFVFILGIIMTIFFPSFSQEKISKKHILQKIIAIIIMFVGTYFLQ